MNSSTAFSNHSLADIFCEKLSNQLSNELREIVEVLARLRSVRHQVLWWEYKPETLQSQVTKTA